MKKIVDLKKILLVGKAVSTDPQRYILHGFLIKDFEKNGQFYRDYVATDGRILLVYREKREKIELESPIIAKPEKIKLTKAEQKYDGIDIELTEIDGIYHHKYGKFEKIDGIFPNYSQIFKSELKETTAHNYIPPRYLKIICEFLETDKPIRFYSENNKQETPQFAMDYNNNNFKMAVVMPMQYLDKPEDLKEINQNLQKWNFDGTN